jgi:hypothetical protein
MNTVYVRTFIYIFSNNYWKYFTLYKIYRSGGYETEFIHSHRSLPLKRPSLLLMKKWH